MARLAVILSFQFFSFSARPPRHQSLDPPPHTPKPETQAMRLSGRLWLALCALGVSTKPVKSPSDQVDVLLGTKSRIDFSVGNILPFVGRPWGMNQWSPQTNNYAPNAAHKAWWFHPEDRELYGIRCTHQPSPWINDYGNFLITPELGALKTSFPDKSSSFNPRDVKISPYQYTAQLNSYCTPDACTTIDLTATDRAAVIRLKFPPYDATAEKLGFDQTRRVRLLLGSNATDSITVDLSGRAMYGWTQANHGGVPKSGPADTAAPNPDDGSCMDDMTIVKGVGLSNHDLYHFQINTTDTDDATTQCAQQCCADARCMAFGVDTPTGGAGRFNCSDGSLPCCWIKDIAEDDGTRGPHVAGWRKGHGPDTLETHFHHYFYLTVDAPRASGGAVLQNVSDNMYDAGLEGYLEFAADDSATEEIVIRIGTSFISLKQAKTNLEREAPASKTFKDIASESKQRWDGVLGVVGVDAAGQDPARVRTFYSSLYRASLFPRNLFEYDEDGKPIHYSPYDSKGRTFPGELASDSGFWDAYRTVYPLTSLVQPDQYARTIRGWLNAYREGGWLPSWPSPGERGAMTGLMQDCTLADAIVKRPEGVNLTLAYEAIHKDLFTVTPPDSKIGRKDLGNYIKLGYLPVDGHADNVVSATLNYALADHSAALAAKSLGNDEDYKTLSARAGGWKLLWDAEALGGTRGQPGFFRAKFGNGSYVPEFDAYAWGGLRNEYTEAAGYQYRFYVPHDGEALAEVYGGGDKMCSALDEMMTASPVYHLGSWGLHHEQVEMVQNCFGQYEHNNQPVHHVMYMFKRAGCPELGQKWLRYGMRTLYGPDVGYSGDEDNGEMASWFVLSAMGLYQLIPADTLYEIGSPLFESVTVGLGGNKTLEILAPGNSDETPYVASVHWNGKPVPSLRIDFNQLRQGGKLVFNMSSDPAAARAFAARV